MQTLLFASDMFTPMEAAHWADDHGFRSNKVDVGKNYHRVRQDSPSLYARSTFRTLPFKRGLMAVVGVPKMRRRRV